jgi:hypothetical protein
LGVETKDPCIDNKCARHIKTNQIEQVVGARRALYIISMHPCRELAHEHLGSLRVRLAGGERLKTDAELSVVMFVLGSVEYYATILPDFRPRSVAFIVH